VKSRWVSALALGMACLALGAWAGARWMSRAEAVKASFHTLYHKRGESTYQSTYWLGVHTQQSPLDMWVFQEILYETRPDVLVETGTFKGGSAYFFASLFDLMKRGRVITIDIEEHKNRPQHERITYLLGSSTSPEILRKVRSLIAPGQRVMVVLDSDHRKAHVAQELKVYSELVTVGCYLVVEDTHFNGHPILPKYGPGPMEAVREFLRSNPQFYPDRSREKFFMTFNPEGYLRRSR